MASGNIHMRLIAALLGAVTVASGTARESLLKTPATVDVIGADELQSMPGAGRSLTEMLNSTPGVTSSGRNGGSGSQLNIRGLGTGVDPLVLINGRRSYGTTSADLLSGVPLDAIERVQLLKGGAATAIYGAEALNGVINIILKRDAELPGRSDAAAEPADAIQEWWGSEFAGSTDPGGIDGFGTGQVVPGWTYTPPLDGDFVLPDGFDFSIPFDPPADPPPSVEPPPPVTLAPDPEPPPAPPTALQQWDRGVPPWSLVENSPEVAHLLEQLRPYYELRFDKRAEMSALGDWRLSDYELEENKAEYDAARDIWKGTRREILTLLGPYLDPAVAAAATTGDPVWMDGPGPVLPADIFGAGQSLVHPSQQAAAAPAEPAPASPGSTFRPGDLRLDVGLKIDYGDLKLRGDYRLDIDPSRYAIESASGPIRIDIQPYLVTPQPRPNGSIGLTPAPGSIFTPNVRYENLLPLPKPGAFKDAEFNSLRGSARGFADETGRLRYSYDPYDAALLDSFRSYDSDRFEQMLERGRDLYDPNTGIFNYDALPGGPADTQASPDVPDFDPDAFRLRYNLNRGAASITVPAYRYEAESVEADCDVGYEDFNPDWRPSLGGSWQIGDRCFYNFRWAEGQRPEPEIIYALPGVIRSEIDYAAIEALPAVGSLTAVVDGRELTDNWFLGRAGFSEQPAAGAPTVVAVIDTGLDYHHYDFDWNNLWRNEGEIPDNGVDDDGNGFVDDLIGWDFTANSNTPWDHDGHGTFVAGLIAADGANRLGISGINPNARIMVLKALNNFGHTRASWLAQAIVYATDNGARVINLSAAGTGLSQFVQAAIDYADSKGVLVIVAAGNGGEDISGISPAGLERVLTVAATDPDDNRAVFSNWGRGVDIAAPGMHIMSLRARQTDFRLNAATTPYNRGDAILGGDRRYYRADGTSFAAPLVAGAASLLWSQGPELTHTEVRRMLEQSARDVDTPGRDQFTGYGRLDVAAALAADPDYFTHAAIDGIAVAVVDGEQVARVGGTADADDFESAVLEIGAGENPDQWREIGRPLRDPVVNGVLGDIPSAELQGQPVWTIRIVIEHADNSRREARYQLTIG
jgi:hypothetical protein